MNTPTATPGNLFDCAGNGQNSDSEPLFYQPADIARRAPCCTATVHRIAVFLGLPISRTGTGQRIFTRDQCRAIIAEIERRKIEVMR